MKNSIIVLLLMLPALVFSQNVPREILNGQVISDSMLVESITVKNITAKSNTVTDATGNFGIYARPGDTLYFSALAFRDAQLVLNTKHFTVEKIIVKLDADVNVLDEVVVTSLTGNLAYDSKKLKIKNYTPAINSGEIIRKMRNEIRPIREADRANTALPSNIAPLNGIDFVKLHALIFKPKPRKPKKEVYMPSEPFSVVVRNRFTDYFFTETLKIPEEEIGLFLTFCDGGSSRALLDPEKESELTDYLILKSAEYLKKDK